MGRDGGEREGGGGQEGDRGEAKHLADRLRVAVARQSGETPEVCSDGAVPAPCDDLDALADRDPAEAAPDVLRRAGERALDPLAPVAEVPPALVVDRDRDARAHELEPKMSLGVAAVEALLVGP
jgi:hypothetical protein